MSAIFGIINEKGKSVSPEQIEKLKQRMVHRTTDGWAEWNDADAYFWFGKLYTHPQQTNEVQPYTQGDLVIVADALLFNRDELFSRLGIDKDPFFPDSALILTAFQKWGKDIVHHLDGEYAFTIWNKVSRELFIVTDHIGFRPVYYYKGPDCFVFCSEIKGIEAVKTTPNYFNEEHIIEYHYRCSPPELTYNKEILALHGGNKLTYYSSTLIIEKYWVLEKSGQYAFKKAQDWFECIRELIYSAIEKRLNTDIPVGVLLSGGLDSTSVACILSQILKKKNKPLYAFSSVLTENHQGIEEDEREYIEIVNKHCGNIIQTYVYGTGMGPFTNVEDAFSLDEEIPNGFHYMDRALLEEAKAKNVSTLFSGYGGDFWISNKGMSAIYTLVQEGNLTKALECLWKLRKYDNLNFPKMIQAHLLAHIKLYHIIRNTIKKPEINWQETSFLKPDFISNYPYLVSRGFTKTQNNRTFMIDFINSGRYCKMPKLFNKRYAFFNIQSADPFFDYQLNTCLANVPHELFIYQGERRSLIRKSMEGILPPEIRWRKNKLAFSPDYAARFQKSKQDALNILLKYENLQEDLHFNWSLLASYVDHLQPHKGMSSPETVLGIRIIQAVITKKVLNFLEKK